MTILDTDVPDIQLDDGIADPLIEHARRGPAARQLVKLMALQRRWGGSACVTIIVILPRRFNPAQGCKRGALIPPFRIQHIKGEFTSLIPGARIGRVESFIPPVLVSSEDGTWVEANAAAPRGYRRYLDPNVLQLRTNVDVDRFVTVLHRVLERAATWAEELQQKALYVEVHGLGLDCHFVVPTRCTVASTE